MAHRRDHKQAARAERLRREQEARRRQHRHRLMRWGGIGAVSLIAVALVAVAVVGGSQGADNMSGSAAGGPALGTIAPNFSLTNVITGRPVTRASLAGHKTLLFFSEGVGCQPCIIQTADLEKSQAFARTGIRLVSITTDPPSALAQAAGQYAIRTPMLADPSTSMSAAYGMLGHGGMQHPTQDGHAFMLLDAKGRVLWHQAYSEMYIDPSQLLADMGPMA